MFSLMSSNSLQALLPHKIWILKANILAKSHKTKKLIGGNAKMAGNYKLMVVICSPVLVLY